MEVREPAIAYSKQKISIEEYLEMENVSPEKHEYYKGEVFAMSGAKGPHVIIRDNILTALKQKLKGKPCKPFAAICAFTLRQTRSLLTPMFLLFAVI